MEDKTNEYYNENADNYSDINNELDMSLIYERFLPHVKAGGHILDGGCGPGRDSKYFLDQGFKVTAFDRSSSMVKLASSITGQNVMEMSFQDIDWAHEFDGVWCCASLLHVPQAELIGVLNSLVKATKSGGVLYVSFKHGHERDRILGDRLFNDQSEDDFQGIVSNIKGVQIKDLWITTDVRPDRMELKWLNAVLMRDTNHTL